jgi:hypothetical protein
MNHPLPKNEQGAIESNSENVAENTSPTWLTQNYRDDDAEFLVNQYRRKHEAAQASGQPENRTYEYYRRRIMERQREQMDSQMDRTPMAAVPPRPTIPAGEIEVRHHFYGSETERGEFPVASTSFPQNSRIRKSLLFAGAFAAVAGGTVGFAVTKYDQISQSVAAAYGFAGSLLPSDTDSVFPPTRETMISKKPIAIASLDVSDVTGTLNSMIPLALNAEPAFEDQKLAIKISGLPASSYLSAGKKLSDNTWILKDGEENDINLFVSQSDKAKFDISIAAIETNTGELAAPVKEMTVAIDDVKLEVEPALQITPASAPPETSMPVRTEVESIASAPVQKTFEPIPTKPALSAEVTGLLEKGDMLMKTGDLIIARQFYTRAFQMGAAEGAMGVARTYDPAVFAEMKVHGIMPDAAKAAEWYEKAKAAGVTEAEAALTTLTAAAQP